MYCLIDVFVPICCNGERWGWYDALGIWLMCASGVCGRDLGVFLLVLGVVLLQKDDTCSADSLYIMPITCVKQSRLIHSYFSGV